MVLNEKAFLAQAREDGSKWLLVVIGGVVFLLALWMTVEAVLVFFKGVRAASADRRRG